MKCWWHRSLHCSIIRRTSRRSGRMVRKMLRRILRKMLMRGEPKSVQTSGEKKQSVADRETDGRHPFSKESCFQNFPLLVDGKRIWVNREYLAEQSKVFRRMFFGGPFKKNLRRRSEVELPEKEVAEIVELLRVIVLQPDKDQLEPITGESRPILILIHHYTLLPLWCRWMFFFENLF